MVSMIRKKLGKRKGERMNNRHVLICTLTAVAVLASGCAALVVTGAVAGAGAYYYARGELTRTYASSFDDTWQATVDSVKALDLKLAGHTKDKLGAELKAIRGDGEEVVLRLTSLKVKLTEVGVRVGDLGDRTASERIHHTILDTLRKRGQIEPVEVRHDS